MAIRKKVLSNTSTLESIVHSMGKMDKQTAVGVMTHDLEGLDATTVSGISTWQRDIEQQINSIPEQDLESIGYGVDKNKLTDVLTAVAAFESAGRATPYGIDTTRVGNVASNIMGNLSSHIDLEGYEEHNLEKFRTANVTFAIRASNQLPFSEAFYGSEIIEANPMGYQLKMPLLEVIISDEHISTNSNNIKTKRLSNALYDSGMFHNRGIELIPLVDDKTSDVVHSTGTTEVDVNGTTVTTADLKLGTEIDLLTASSHPGLVGAAVLTSTDTIDPAGGLKSLTVAFTNTTADPDVTTPVSFALSQFTSAKLKPSNDGMTSKMDLAFRDKVTVGVNELTDPAFAGISTNRIVYMLDVRCTIDILSGMTTPVHANISFSHVINAAGGRLVKGSAEETNVLAAINSAVPTGFKLDLKRTNSNMRTQGHRITSNDLIINYPVGCSAQFTAESPVETTPAVLAETLSTSASLAASARAMIHLEKWYNHCEQSHLVESSPQSYGPAAAYMLPYAKTIVADLAEITTIESSGRAEDVRGFLIGKCREAVFEAATLSHIETMFHHLGAGKPRVIVGTTPNIAGHIMVTGDDRTFGNGYDFDIVTSQYKELMPADNEAYIYMAFTDPNAEVGPTRFGTHFFMPPTIKDLAVGRNSQTSREVTVTPRSEHYAHIPCLFRVRVINTDKVTSNA